jgi:antitoxin ChpS
LYGASSDVKYLSDFLEGWRVPKSASSGILATATLKKAGGSLVVTVPASARKILDLRAGQEMSISVEGSRVVMEPVETPPPQRVRRPKYTLDDLLAGSVAEAPLSDEERSWQDEPPTGREIW